MAVLEVEDLRVIFDNLDDSVAALTGVSFRIDPGEVVCMVGESGCGKTLSALSVLGVLPSNARVEVKRMEFLGRDLRSMSEEELQHIRGKEIGMIFQEPMTSLNPVFTIGYQIEEAILTHENVSQEEATDRAAGLLNSVGIQSPEERLGDYPHQLSGGQRQRVMIAMALACNPKLLIADEPTTALDVTVQAQILRLFRELREKHDMALLYITHDLRVVAQLADRIYVMYSGTIAEHGNVRSIYGSPKHPYTRGLMNSLPSHAKRGERLNTIAGYVPDPRARPSGCPFHPRCPEAVPRCRDDFPEMCRFEDDQFARCPVVHGSWPKTAEAEGSQ